MEYNLIATATFGIEAITARELKNLGYDDLKVENGKVYFTGDEMDIAICNIHLRTADRILINMGEFTALTFEDLFQGTLSIPWEDIIPIHGKMHVVGKSINSTLHSVPDCQSIVKKAIVNAMKRKYKMDTFNENGPVYKIEVAILKDVVTLSIDTSGPGLHKRGYREGQGGAPLKETLAAALILISKWNSEYVFADPFCGSGTIPIEAALIGNNIPPGLNRNFVCETWPTIDKDLFDDVRKMAKIKIKHNKLLIYASDNDIGVLRKAIKNAENAGVKDYISFQKIDFREFSTRKKYGYIVCNPPYGERLGDEKQVLRIYKDLRELYDDLETWNLFLLTSNEKFEESFGLKPTKNRKLYNGKLKCYYYQYIR